MANQEHLDILAKGVEAWNTWREQVYGTIDSSPHIPSDTSSDFELSGLDLSQADLRDADLREANLRRVDLSRANLSRANLSGGDLRYADLQFTSILGANLYCTDLRGSRLRSADLRRTDLRQAILRGTDLRGAELHSNKLDGTDFGGSIFGYTTLGDMDLSNTRGIETASHDGPSVIGVETIFRSKGNIPDFFLRGLGLPENFIVYVKSLTGAALEFYSCFISYSTNDQNFADRLHADLQAKGVRCWFASHDIRGGRKIHEQIDEAIRMYDKLLLILSDASMTSEWVNTEISKARKRRAVGEAADVVSNQCRAIRRRSRLGMLRCRCREGFCTRNPRVLHPGLLQLEGSRLVPESV
jgi:hypothetical protein